jgi:hypothetical protein
LSALTVIFSPAGIEMCETFVTMKIFPKLLIFNTKFIYAHIV